MTATVNTGGPAFPVLPPCDMEGASASGYPYPDAGMTLRDYFAAKAMRDAREELIREWFHFHEDNERPEINPDRVARMAYAMADAMLKERAK